MENGNFEIIKSNKAGLVSEECLLVVRDHTSYLRVLGQEPRWELMTATASEDDGSVKICSDRRRVIEAAIRLSQALGCTPQKLKDLRDIEYIKICVIERRDDDPTADLCRTIKSFFELFDRAGEGGNGRADDMVNIYEAMSSGGDGEDVYLSDGLWLSRNGSLHERGR